MARLPRIVIPGLPHHVTQRGNGRQRVFFTDSDYAAYRDGLGEACGDAGVQIWAWVLMPNHVHMILVPGDEDGLRRALAPLHRHYAGRIHAREQRTGHFWQGRFGSVAMDEAHLGAALRYVALNPVRAGLVDRPTDWRWSSAHAQLGADDGITATGPVRERYPDFAALIETGEDDAASDRLRKAEAIGRPLGDERFLTRLETMTGRKLKPGKRGPKRRYAN